MSWPVARARDSEVWSCASLRVVWSSPRPSSALSRCSRWQRVLGGFESLAELPSRMTHASITQEERTKLGISDTLIRLSVGLEEEEDLLTDLEQALKKAVPDSLL
eukprot:scpid65101/ scgid12191/ Cystathionine gamma-lyase; Cysteine-protein sulfhydrase; Gamma-cystathionase